MKDGSHNLTERDLLEYARALHDYPPGQGFCLETLNEHIEDTGLRAVHHQDRLFLMEPIPIPT